MGTHMNCNHTRAEQHDAANDPLFCPLCMHEQIGELLSVNRTLIRMIERLRADGRTFHPEPSPDTSREGDRDTSTATVNKS